jgi:hypothetical protein
VDYYNQTFENEEVILDGNSFENCTFTNVVFNYGGGHLVMKNCGMDRFSFRFSGDLANGLFALHQLFGTEGLLQIIRGFVEPAQGGDIELQLPGSPS